MDSPRLKLYNNNPRYLTNSDGTSGKGQQTCACHHGFPRRPFRRTLPKPFPTQPVPTLLVDRKPFPKQSQTPFSASVNLSCHLLPLDSKASFIEPSPPQAPDSDPSSAPSSAPSLSGSRPTVRFDSVLRPVYSGLASVVEAALLPYCRRSRA